MVDDMNDGTVRNQWADEEQAIRRTIELYFHALDLLDPAVLNEIFAPDVEVRYHVGTEGEFSQSSRDEVVAYLMGNMGSYAVRTHLGANSRVWPDGTGARAVTTAIALISKDGAAATMRGLRYEDRLVRDGAAWRIGSRRHTPLWQFNATLAELHVPALAVEIARRQKHSSQ